VACAIAPGFGAQVVEGTGSGEVLMGGFNGRLEWSGSELELNLKIFNFGE